MTARPVRPDFDDRPVSGTAVAVEKPHVLERMRGILDALPHPAAIVQIAQGETPAFMCNGAFEAFVEARRADKAFDYEYETRLWTPHLHAVASGEEDSFHGDVSFAGGFTTRVFRVSITRIAGPSPGPAMVLYTAIDRTDEHMIENVLRRELLTDTLTALPNRAGFLEQVEARTSGSGKGQAIIVVDVVRFSRVNESLGAIAGDELIITVARRIKSILRSNDLLGRVGGNEFAIHSNAVFCMEDAQQIANRVRTALEKPLKLSSYRISIDVAVGCAIRQLDDEEPEELFRRAQTAVKQSKQSGAFEIYKPSALTEAQERFTLESRLRDALQNDALEMEFQPILSLSDGEVVGFEALARWTDAELGSVPPSRFIPVAEESGLIVPLGRWALRKSADCLAKWDRAYGRHVPLSINVNVSPVQIARDNVPSAVREALTAAQVDGKRLTVELTESALIADLQETRALLSALKAMDITIAMDDFGTGFSNLANLQTLPIDILKIDQSFVTGMVGDPDKVAIVRAILSLAHALGMRTVAEGIETAEVSWALAELGCDRGQGYYYARPMTPDTAYAFWLERSQPATT
jgi:cyclic di-GMP phosphodiesterase Gmr